MQCPNGRGATTFYVEKLQYLGAVVISHAKGYNDWGGVERRSS